MDYRPITVPALSCSLLKMTPRQYSIPVTFDVSATVVKGERSFDTCNLAEPWWVNSLIRNPVILPYAHGIRRLDKIYLDTTFASTSIAHRRFPTKEDGLKELLEKVRKYPIDTCFHLHAWTFGYEDVWIALSSALKSQVALFLIDQQAWELTRSRFT